MSKMAAIVTILPSKISGENVSERCSTSDGEIHTGSSSLHKAARHLIGTGSPPGRKMQVMRDGKVVLIGTVHAFAVMTWGGANKDPESVRWRPFPGEILPPRLAAWHAQVQAGRATAR